MSDTYNKACVEVNEMMVKIMDLVQSLQHDWEDVDYKFKIIILILGLLLLWELFKDKTVLFVVFAVIIVFFAITFWVNYDAVWNIFQIKIFNYKED